METDLTTEELRVLACLIEKSFTTPDHYPMTTNALTNACNQKTSRDPVVDFASQLVDETMLLLRQGKWARSIRGSGSRSFKHKHIADERLALSDPELAVFAVLALRGPQSAGELRTRTERYETFSADGDEGFAAIEAVLSGLAQREVPLTRNVGRASGQSQDRWIQLIGTAGGASGPSTELTQATPPIAAVAPVHGAPSTAVAVPPAAVRQSTDGDELEQLKARIAELEQRVTDLEELL